MLYSYAVYVFLLNPYMFARDCIQESLMIGPYRELFFVAGTQVFALAGLLARIALPMTGIGIIVMLSQMRGSYALAGGVSAVFVLTYA